MMHAVAARAAASAAAAAALVASATAFASRASTSVRGARLACNRGASCAGGVNSSVAGLHTGRCMGRLAGGRLDISKPCRPLLAKGNPLPTLSVLTRRSRSSRSFCSPVSSTWGHWRRDGTVCRAAALCRTSWHGRLGHACPAARAPCSARPRPPAHLQLAVAVHLVVQPPLLDCIHDQAAAQGHACIWRRLATVRAGPSKRDDVHAGIRQPRGNVRSSWRHMAGGPRAMLLCHVRPITQGQPVPPAADQAHPTTPAAPAAAAAPTPTGTTAVSSR